MNTGSSLRKPASRLVGIAESTPLNEAYTILGAVVMRGDLIIDGMIWRIATLRGMDATDSVISLINQLARDDLGGIMLHGSVIAGYNIIDLHQIFNTTNLPVISVTKELQEDLREHLMATFPDNWKIRWDIARRNGTTQQLALKTGSIVHIQSVGLDWKTVKVLLNRFSRFGALPEPIRVARILARALAKKVD